MTSVIYNVMKSPADLKPHPENLKIYGDEKPDEGLIESIKENGILEMLIITKSGTIISGHRRWLAAKECGLQKVPCIIREYDTSLAERHEIVEHNRYREKSTIQLAKEGEVYEEWERERARLRQEATRAQPGQQVGQVKEKFPEPDAGQRRDAVGAKLGMSGKTYDKVKTLYDYAKEGNELAMYYMVEADAGRMSIDKAFKKFLEVNGRNNIHGFNKTNDNIEWAKWTWNPVTGCKYNCEYCYARDIGMRFNGTFDPEFHPERLHAPEVTTIPKNPDQGDKTVFVCSMGELFGEWIPNEWILPVIDVVKKNSQWNFLFLTKNPKRLPEFSFPENAWVGTTVDIQSRVASAEKAMREVQAKIKFLSCEPLLEPVRFNDLSVFNWLIIGGRSQNSRGPASQPEWMWVESLLNQAREAGVSVYFKPNLTVRPREYPGMSSS